MKAAYFTGFSPPFPFALCSPDVRIQLGFRTLQKRSIRPGFNQPFTTWAGERVRVVLTPSIQGEQGESLRCLANYDRVLLANALRQRGLKHEYKIIGKGTPLVV